MKIKLLLSMIAAGALLAGCSNMKSVESADGAKVKYQVVATGETEDRINVINVAVAKAGDLARANVELQNDSNFDIQFQYRFKWYDAGGMEINAEGTGWTPVSMMGQETKSLQSTAPNPTGETFKLFLQENP